LRLTIRLGKGTLRLEAEVRNPDAKPLPFGLGYHPYFRLGEGEESRVEVPAREYWVLEGNLPTGQRLPAVGQPVEAGEVALQLLGLGPRGT